MARIVHVCSSAEFAQYLSELLPALKADGHDVHFVSTKGPEAQALLGTRGITLHSMPIARGIDPVADVRAVSELTSLLRKLRPDLVHAHTPKGGLVGMLAARAARVRSRVYQLHGLRYETARGARKALLLSSDRLAASLAHRVVCVSPSVRTRAVSDGVVPEGKVRLLAGGSAQGISPERFERDDWLQAATELKKQIGLSENSGCVVYVGRLAGDKGLADLKAAWIALRRGGVEASLLLAGRSDPTDPLEPGLFDNVAGLHVIDHLDDPRPLLACADVLVLPSRREGLPQAILEAGAMRVPVVGTWVTGIVDAVMDGQTGLLVPPSDPDALRAALEALLADPERRAQMGRAGHEHVRTQFSLGPILSALRELYDELL